MWPIEFSSAGVVKLLVEANASVGEETGQHKTALMLAGEGGHRDVAEYLVANASVNAKGIGPPIHWALAFGDEEEVTKETFHLTRERLF